MKKRTPYSIAVLIIVMATTFFLTDNSIFNKIILNIKSYGASVNIQNNSEEQNFSVDPELLAIPFSSNPETIITHSGFSLQYSPAHEQAAWVAYVLTSKEVHGNVPRSNNFREDSSVISGSASLADYKGSGFDRGHMAPAGDLKWSQSSMKDSFFMSNMSPQVPGFNRDIWKRLEEWTRDQAVDNSELIVVTGPVLTDGPYKEIGENGVDIPKKYFKVLLDYTGPDIKAIGFIMNNEASKANIIDFAASIDDVEKLTGLDFFYLLPDTSEENLESQYDINLWKTPL